MSIPKIAPQHRLVPLPHTIKQHEALLVNNAAKRKFPVEHGIRTRLYQIWRAMHFRCYQTSHEAYPRYGGAGITVCDEWRTDYGAFREWALGNGYAEHLTIDRIDNSLGYSPGNCRWATMLEQQQNRSNLRLVTVFGETKCVREWARDPRCQVGCAGLHHRLDAGTEPEEAITTPSRTHKTGIKRLILTAWGETKSIQEWACDPRSRGTLGALYWRSGRNWPPKAVITGERED